MATGEATKLPDEALIAAMAAGRQDALRIFVQRYGPAIAAVSDRVLGNTADAEEVTADVLWQCWNQAARFDRSRGSVGAWVVTLARSRAIDRLRARRLRERAPSELDVQPVPRDDPAATFQNAESRVRIKSALGCLKDGERQLIEMAFWSDLTQSEIASRTGLPLGTVKTRIRSGLLRLREELRRSGG
ncbi:MAG TPA: sigma-70 family RNA polymerase sigma factor [Candidatus Binataceae bacterium]|nr:sigma-70 family RNA polymerase sigma factor [Candidatus Binataceae bacterium]